MSNSSYVKVNLILAGLILSVFLLSVTYSFIELQMPSNIKIITGNETASTGLSRGFSEIFQYNFRKAQEYNSSSLRIFGFLLFQFIFRLALIPVSKRFKERNIVLFDVILSLLLFIVAFYKILTGLYIVY
ncbi:MAG: hypothetical protein ACLFPH_05855 [Bacteroidales bacterium]